MDRIVIHIGLHKTGTTFLQHSLFPKIPKTTVIRGFHSHREMMQASVTNQIIISDERLSGSLWSGSYQKDFYANINSIKQIYDNPKIIFGIRNQEGFITSIYKQFLHEKGFNEINHLYNLDNNGLIMHEELLLMPKIKCLSDNFQDVFIYSQESLFERQDDFISGLLTFLNIECAIQISQEPNSSNIGVSSEFQVGVLKKLNRINNCLEKIHPKLSLYSIVFQKLKITPRTICQVYLKNVKSKKFELSKDYKDFINDYYCDDWSEASKLVAY